MRLVFQEAWRCCFYGRLPFEIGWFSARVLDKDALRILSVIDVSLVVNLRHKEALER